MPSSFVIAMAETADGDLWLGTRDTGLLRVRDGLVSPMHVRLPDTKVNALQAGPDGMVWIATDRGVARWRGGHVAPSSLPPDLRDASAHALTRDRDGNLWIGLGARGLARVDALGNAAVVPWDARTRGDVTALFEDRSGNLWVGTSRGIERLREGPFRTFTVAEGLPGEGPGAIFADAQGRVWMGPPSGGLYWLEAGRVGHVRDADLDADVVYTISGREGDVWIGRRRGGLTRVRMQGSAHTITRVTTAVGLAQDSVFAVHHARDGSVWAGTLSAGLSRYRNGVVTTYRAGDGLASNTIAALLETDSSEIWVGTPAGVSIHGPDGWRTLDARRGLPGNDVTSLLQDRSGTVWVGTSEGLAYVEQGRAYRVGPILGLEGAIHGLAQDHAGWLWIATGNRVLQAEPGALRAGSVRTTDVRTYSPVDGLPGGDVVKRHRSLVADAQGSIWLSQGYGLAEMDATRPLRLAEPTAPVIDVATADDVPLQMNATVDVPARTHRVALTLGGANLTLPERVRFRYRLDGFDADWSTATASRQAVYTNLPPGAYDFRVVASDSAGTWAGAETRISLRVAPAYWQTTWFRGGLMFAVVAAGWGVYRIRMRQLAHQMAHVFEQRLAERTRIAQDLHDTLLQGCLSAGMQLHVAIDRLAEVEPSRPSFERVQQLLSRVVDEGREAVRGLRLGDAAVRDGLEQALSRTPGEMAPDHPAGFRVVVEGDPRPLHPIIRDDAYRIGREAIANALRHANARHIEVDVAYTAAHLRLSVRDDGRGIDDVVMRDGRAGHWGLEGMRERAQAIGASLRILSRADAGTEVELVVPGHLAFAADESGTPRGRWWRRRDHS